jgi:transposase
MGRSSGSLTIRTRATSEAAGRANEAVERQARSSSSVFKRGGRVYTAVPPDLKRATLLPIIRQRVEPDSVVYTDGFSVYDTLNASGFEHYRIDHGEGYVDYGMEGANGRLAHINGIENFWNQAKRHLRRYNGVPKAHFELFLKECEWRFNYGSPRELLKTLLRWTVI